MPVIRIIADHIPLDPFLPVLYIIIAVIVDVIRNFLPPYNNKFKITIECDWIVPAWVVWEISRPRRLSLAKEAADFEKYVSKLQNWHWALLCVVRVHPSNKKSLGTKAWHYFLTRCIESENKYRYAEIGGSAFFSLPLAETANVKRAYIVEYHAAPKLIFLVYLYCLFFLFHKRLIVWIFLCFSPSVGQAFSVPTFLQSSGGHRP